MGAVLYDNVMDDDLVDEFEVAKHVFVCARARAALTETHEETTPSVSYHHVRLY